MRESAIAVDSVKPLQVLDELLAVARRMPATGIETLTVTLTHALSTRSQHDMVLVQLLNGTVVGAGSILCDSHFPAVRGKPYAQALVFLTTCGTCHPHLNLHPVPRHSLVHPPGPCTLLHGHGDRVRHQVRAVHGNGVREAPNITGRRRGHIHGVWQRSTRDLSQSHRNLLKV